MLSLTLQAQIVKIDGSPALQRAFAALKRALTAALPKGFVKFTESH